MYTITIDMTCHNHYDNPNQAWLVYRAIAKDFANRDKLVVLWQDSEVLSQKTVGETLNEPSDSCTPNDVLMTLIQSLGMTAKDAKDIIKSADLGVSNSRIDGWMYQSDNRRHVPLHNDELAYLVQLLVKNKQ